MALAGDDLKGFGLAAVIATENIQRGLRSPIKAWQEACKQVFPQSGESQKKSCPKCAFLGLCQAGHVVGVPTGRYTRSQLNARYATEAAEIIGRSPALNLDKEALWKRVQMGGGRTPVHNGQLDVVLALHQRGYLRSKQR